MEKIQTALLSVIVALLVALIIGAFGFARNIDQRVSQLEYHTNNTLEIVRDHEGRLRIVERSVEVSKNKGK